MKHKDTKPQPLSKEELFAAFAKYNSSKTVNDNTGKQTFTIPFGTKK